MLRAAAKNLFVIAILALPATAPLGAQDANIGLTMPVTLSGQLLHTERGRAIDSGARTGQPSFRDLAYPALKLGDHWYFYSALQLEQEPYSYYDMYYPESKFASRWTQAYLGYRSTGEEHAVGFKIGKMITAFGAHPLRYDDAVNPLKLRPDALPCGTKDLPNLRYYEDYEGVIISKALR